MLDFSREGAWIIAETDFDPTALGKAEANFCLGNGYLGLRSATEERYPGETRDLLIAGTFDRFSEEEVTELPNATDVTNIELVLGGERFDLTRGEIKAYSCELNLKTGLLTRHVVWQSPGGKSYITSIFPSARCLWSAAIIGTDISAHRTPLASTYSGRWQKTWPDFCRKSSEYEDRMP